ncbi:MAG: DUF452 family protein [Muribaculaceae bacterium]|nr:DUF452 family protein [Muribaculaceae bacterium]
MRRELIHREEGNRSAIAFFAGWAMDGKPFGNLRKSGYDIYLFYDYRTVEPELYTGVFGQYDSVALVAWSFGVAVANRLLTGDEEIRIAVNGTAQGVDNQRGLPKPYNALTLRRLSEATLLSFYKRVFPEDVFPDFFTHLPARPLSELADELRVMGDTVFDSPKECWDKVFIGASDLIIPLANQLKSWEKFHPTVIEKGAHGIDFQKLLDTEIVNKKIVAQSFTRKAETYEAHAAVQRQMASALIDLLTENSISVRDRQLLEVGIGTGFLTRLYCDDCPASITAVDLADSATLTEILRSSGCNFTGEIITADAERFIAGKKECYDIILTASTIQWFNSQRRFLADCASALRPGGILAIATFAPGTFHEISDITGSSLNYRSGDWYAECVSDLMTMIASRCDSVTLEFNSPRQLLEHISLTGVNAVDRSAGDVNNARKLMRMLPAKPTLTYNPIYMIFRKL